LNYVRRRAVYRLTDLEEWRLAWGSLRYLLLDRGRKEGGAASSATSAERDASREKSAA